jgi:hypothetical protein
VRHVLRALLVAAALWFAWSWLVEAGRSWTYWHDWITADPSAADLARTTFWVDGAVLMTLAATVVFVWWLIGRLAARR